MARSEPPHAELFLWDGNSGWYHRWGQGFLTPPPEASNRQHLTQDPGCSRYSVNDRVLHLPCVDPSSPLTVAEGRV